MYISSVSSLLPPRRFSCPVATGAIYHHGAHVIDWTPKGSQPVIWMSEKTHLDSESAIRGGIPICWPWFGAGRSGNSTPMHGFARLDEWRLVESVTTGEQATSTWLLIGEGKPSFPYPYRLTYTVSFGSELHIALTVRNTSTSRFTFEQALHTYLRVGDTRKISLIGLDGARYLDRAQGAEPGPHTQRGDIRFGAETDRIYRSDAEITVQDPALDRALVIKREGSADAVVWNPWIDKAASMPDFGDDEWQTMVCVETANVGEDAITLASGKEHTMSFSVEISSL